MATISRPELAEERLVERIGETKNGHALVRYATSSVVAVGWIGEKWLVPYETNIGGLSGIGSYGQASAAGDAKVVLRRGDVLRAPGTREAVGIVLVDGAQPCVDRCDGTEPVVRVHACTGGLELVASRADPPPAR